MRQEHSHTGSHDKLSLTLQSPNVQLIQNLSILPRIERPVSSCRWDELEHRHSGCTHVQRHWVGRTEWNCHLTGAVTTPQKAILSVYLTCFRVCAPKFIYLFVAWKRLRGDSRHHLASGMCTRFIKLCRQEGRNSHVTQDHIGVCHMKTNMNKKAREHMNFRTHTRNAAKSTDKSAFSVSSHDQRDCSFP